MSLIFDPTLAAVLDVVRGAIMVLFVVCALLVILVVLAQEGKGGGLAGAFGGAGAETFGVKAGTVNKFTAYLAALFLGLALLHAGLTNATSAPGGANIDDLTPAKKGAPKAPGKGAPAVPPKKAPGDGDKKGDEKGDGDAKKEPAKKDGGGDGKKKDGDGETPPKKK